MKYSKSIDRAAVLVARRMWTISDDDSAVSSMNKNPLFYPCVVAFAAVMLEITSPFSSVLMRATQNWLPSPIIVWGVLVFCVYPVARFFTTLLALRSR